MNNQLLIHKQGYDRLYCCLSFIVSNKEMDG